MADYDTIEEVKPEAAPIIPAGFEYDTPPPEWVPGTVVPHDTAPEDMTNTEWAQWAYDNLMPFWAIKKGLLQRTPPTITSIEPSTAAIGDPSFQLIVTGTNFHAESVIVFAGQSENTTLNEDGTLSTGVNMNYWHGPDAVPVLVDNGMSESDPVDFTFTAAAPEADAEAADDHDGDDHPAKKAKKKK